MNRRTKLNRWSFAYSENHPREIKKTFLFKEGMIILRQRLDFLRKVGSLIVEALFLIFSSYFSTSSAIHYYVWNFFRDNRVVLRDKAVLFKTPTKENPCINLFHYLIAFLSRFSSIFFSFETAVSLLSVFIILRCWSLFIRLIKNPTKSIRAKSGMFAQKSQSHG